MLPAGFMLVHSDTLYPLASIPMLRILHIYFDSIDLLAADYMDLCNIFSIIIWLYKQFFFPMHL